jgi:hypothetical protein
MPLMPSMSAEMKIFLPVCPAAVPASTAVSPSAHAARRIVSPLCRFPLTG